MTFQRWWVSSCDITPCNVQDTTALHCSVVQVVYVDIVSGRVRGPAARVHGRGGQPHGGGGAGGRPLVPRPAPRLVQGDHQQHSPGYQHYFAQFKPTTTQQFHKSAVLHQAPALLHCCCTPLPWWRPRRRCPHWPRSIMSAQHPLWRCQPSARTLHKFPFNISPTLENQNTILRLENIIKYFVFGPFNVKRTADIILIDEMYNT